MLTTVSGTVSGQLKTGLTVCVCVYIHTHTHTHVCYCFFHYGLFYTHISALLQQKSVVTACNYWVLGLKLFTENLLQKQ